MKRMIALLPCLEGAGGIRVLLDLFQGIQKMGYQINVWSQLEGSFRQKFEEMGINVQIQKNMLDETFTLNVKDDEDIFVNTLQMFPVIKNMNDMGMPNRIIGGYMNHLLILNYMRSKFHLIFLTLWI